MGGGKSLDQPLLRRQVNDVVFVVLFFVVLLDLLGVDTDLVFDDLGCSIVANAGDVDGHCTALILVFFKHGCGECSINTHFECSHLAWVVIVERDLDHLFDDVFTARLNEYVLQLFESCMVGFGEERWRVRSVALHCHLHGAFWSTAGASCCEQFFFFVFHCLFSF